MLTLLEGTKMKNASFLLMCLAAILSFSHVQAASDDGLAAFIRDAYEAARGYDQTEIHDLLNVFFAPVTGSSRILFVDGMGGNDHWTGRQRTCASPNGPKRTLGAAISVASAGDIIIVLPAVYAQNIIISHKDLLIIGFLPEETIIDGGGRDSTLTIINSHVSIFGITVRNGSAASSEGMPVGGGILVNSSTLVMVNSVVRDNTAQAGGGGLFVLNGDLILHNCQILGNRTTGGGAAGAGLQGGSIKSRLTSCVFEDNEIVRLGDGAGISGFGGSIINCVITNNRVAFEAENGGGGLAYCTGPIVGCTITNNSVEFGDGGGAYACTGPFTNCIISGNRAFSGIGDVVPVVGGGLANCTGPITDCLIAGNVSENSNDAGVESRGGGLAGCTGAIVNCTIVNNEAVANAFGSRGGGLINCTGPIANCIIWANIAASDAQLSATSTPNHSCIQDFAGGGTGNIAADPLFVNPASDHRLRGGSPCIDAGNNIVVPVTLVTDLAGGARFLDDPGTVDTGSGTPPIVDMGVFEHINTCGDAAHPYPAMDFNHDCIVDYADFAIFCQHWMECTL